MEFIQILPTQDQETIQYAAEELKKYITELSRGHLTAQIRYGTTPTLPAASGTIVLGTLEELSLDCSDLSDPFVEDIIDVDVTNGTGYIAGSNPRSILMGVYKYCESAGCRYLRPGPDGDYIPEADLTTHAYTYRKKADYPFRGECCEGAISYEHMRDTVYWLPKIGMNVYMIEGIVPYSYMHKWYGHVGNEVMRQKGQRTDYNMLKNYVTLLERDIKRAGLQLHTLGHGWMFEKLGTRDLSTPKRSVVLSEADKRHLALLKGVRDIRNDPFYTQFCYSNPETRKLLVDTLIEYIQQKPHVDFVHVWLADSINNHCECEECQKMIPTDYYVMFLNELDAALTAMGSNARIVLIMYVETERPPQKTKILNPGRFVILSAIGQHYDKGYLLEEIEEEDPPYVRNQYKPASTPVRMKWHRQWKQHCGFIPSFLYEYRFYTDMYCDLGHMQLSREAHRDMRSLEKISFQGSIDDQTHRMYMPTSLPMIMMGHTMFDRDTDYEATTSNYFASAFGTDGDKCREYLETMSTLLSPSNFRKGGKNTVEDTALGNVAAADRSWLNNPLVAERARKIPGLVQEFLPVIEKNVAFATNNAQLMSWEYLKHHGAICTLFSDMLVAGAENGLEAALPKYDIISRYVSEHEMEFHNVFDVFLFLRALRMKLGLGNFNYYD